MCVHVVYNLIFVAFLLIALVVLSHADVQSVKSFDLVMRPCLFPSIITLHHFQLMCLVGQLLRTYAQNIYYAACYIALIILSSSGIYKPGTTTTF